MGQLNGTADPFSREREGYRTGSINVSGRVWMPTRLVSRPRLGLRLNVPLKPSVKTSVVPAGGTTPESSRRRVHCRAPSLLRMSNKYECIRESVFRPNYYYICIPVHFCPVCRTGYGRSVLRRQEKRHMFPILALPLQSSDPSRIEQTRPRNRRNDRRSVCYATAFRTLSLSRSRPWCVSQTHTLVTQLMA